MSLWPIFSIIIDQFSCTHGSVIWHSYISNIPLVLHLRSNHNFHCAARVEFMRKKKFEVIPKHTLK